MQYANEEITEYHVYLSSRKFVVKTEDEVWKLLTDVPGISFKVQDQQGHPVDEFISF